LEQYFLRPDQAVLLVIDIQEKLVPAMKFGQKVIDNTKILLATAEKFNIPVVFTEQYPKGLGKTVPELLSLASESATAVSFHEKLSFSGCTDEVKAKLKELGRTKILVTGMETHICVWQTIRELRMSGYQVFAVGDAVCSRSKENYLNGLSLISAVGAVVINTETAVFDLLQQAGTPIFKEVSKLIK